LNLKSECLQYGNCCYVY